MYIFTLTRKSIINEHRWEWQKIYFFYFFTDAPVLLCYVENALIETKFAFRKNERKFSERKTLKGSRRMDFLKKKKNEEKKKKIFTKLRHEWISPHFITLHSWNVLLEGIIKYGIFCMVDDDFWLHSWNDSP